jgi:adenylosuccinate synthase
VKPQYETIRGWETTTEGRRLEDLPPRAIAYIRRLEQLVGCRIHLVSLGPERSAMVEMPRARGAAVGL